MYFTAFVVSACAGLWWAHSSAASLLVLLLFLLLSGRRRLAPGRTLLILTQFLELFHGNVATHSRLNLHDLLLIGLCLDKDLLFHLGCHARDLEVDLVLHSRLQISAVRSLAIATTILTHLLFINNNNQTNFERIPHLLNEFTALKYQ